MFCLSLILSVLFSLTISFFLSLILSVFFFFGSHFSCLAIFLLGPTIVGYVIFPSWRSFDGKYGHYCDIYDYHYLIDGNVCAWACSLGLIMRVDIPLWWSVLGQIHHGTHGKWSCWNIRLEHGFTIVHRLCCDQIYSKL